MLSFFRQFFIYGFANVIGKIAAVFLLPFYTNILTPEEYGAMAVLVAVKGIIDLFSNLNIHSGVARDYYEKGIDRRRLISTGLFSILCFSISVFVVLYISRKFLVVDVLNVAGHEKAFVIMLLTIPAESLLSYFAVLIRLKKRAALYATGTSLQLFVQISLTVYLVLVERTGIVGVFYGILCGEIMGTIFFFILNREYVTATFDKDMLGHVLIYSLPTLPAILAGWVDSSLGQILIGKYISVKDVAIYSIAVQVSSVFLLINTAFGNVWYPYLFENIKKKNFYDEVLRLIRLVVFVLSVISVNLSLLSNEIITLLSNENYLAASRYLILLTIPMSMTIINWFATMGPSISRNTKYISYATAAGSVMNVAIIAILLPAYGVIVVPISLALSRFVSYFISSFYTKREISLSLPHQPIIFLTFGVSVCFFLVELISNHVILWGALLSFNLVAAIYLCKTQDVNSFIRKLIYVKV